MLHSGAKHWKICEAVGIWRTTLYRDFKRCKDHYNAEEAHSNASESKNLIDWKIIGKRFGLLTVLRFANIYKKRSWWVCKCDCGKECIISRKILAERCSKRRELSCGCIPKQHKYRENRVPIEESALRKFHDLLKFRKIRGSCWNWTGYKQKGKIPKTSWNSKSMGVRKCIYLIMNGITEEPNPVYVTCGNLECFNPDHITLQAPAKRDLYE